jgi:PKD repeat protein
MKRLLLALVLLLVCIVPVNAAILGWNASIDGYVSRTSDNMTIAQVVGAGTGASTTGTSMYTQLATFPGTTNDNFHVGAKIVWSADTSNIPDGAVITDARFNYTVFQNFSTMQPYYMTITNGTTVTDGAIVAGDYARNGSTEYITRVLWSDAKIESGTDQKSVIFNAAGLAGINKTGYTTLFIQISDLHDTAFTGTWATAPVVGANNTVNMRSNDHATASYRPVLNITYTVPTTLYPMKYVNDTRILPNSDVGLPTAGDTLTINSSQGEITQGSFIIKAPAAVTDMSTNATILTNETGGTMNTGILNITLVKAWWQSPNNFTYVNYISTVLKADWALTPELLLHNDSIVRADLTAQTTEVWVENATFSGYKHIDNTSIGGWLKDYKIVDDPASNGFPIPFALSSGHNKQVMIKTMVPADTPAGNYTGLVWVNSSATVATPLTLTVRVLPFTLPNNTRQHGFFNIDSIDAAFASSYDGSQYIVTQANYTNMLRNLKEHGILHAQVQSGTGGWEASTETMMDLRDALDFPKDAVFMRGYRFVDDNIAANITNEAMDAHVTEVQTVYAAANGTHGIVDVYFQGLDEGDQGKYIFSRPIYENITANDGKVWSTANYNISHLGDLVAVHVSSNALSSPYTPTVDGTWLNLSQRNYSHTKNNKAFYYMGPQIGIEYPETYRKHFGLALVKWGFDGGMNYQWYRHQIVGANTTWNEYQKTVDDATVGGWYKPGGFVYPKYAGYIDTLSYEGYREGTNDQRYADMLDELTGSNRSSIDTISAGFTDKQDMQEIRYNLTNQILAELALPAPTAAFSGLPVSGTEPLSVTFTDASTDTPTSWLWEYQNATVGWTTFSTSQNPTTSFPAGLYDIRLTATNAGGSDDETKVGYITVAVVPPTSAYSGTPTTGTAPVTVTFTDASTSTPTSWKWAYKNATKDWTVFSTAQNPSVAFPAGVYDINLTATNAGGSDDEIKVSYLTFTVPAPGAAYTADRSVVRFPGNSTVFFTDTSTGTPTGWDWYFGDGTANVTTQNINHHFTKRGYVLSCLIATNGGGSNTYCDYIRVIPGDSN